MTLFRPSLTAAALTAAAITLSLLSTASLAAAPALELTGTISEGALVRGQTTPGSTVTVDGTAVPVSQDGHFVFGLARDRDEAVTLEIRDTTGAVLSRHFEVAQRDYDIERIDGLPPRMVNPRSPEVIARIQAESAQKKAARPTETRATWYTEDFIWPVTGRISGTYGSQRILNGDPKRPHFGVDIAAPKGTPVKAPASGVVTLAEPNMYFEGGLVFLDHGHGVISVLMHLDEVLVEPGQEIAQGETVATVGSTGRSTGPHLDWRMYWRNARVDPTGLVGPMPGR